MEQLLKENWFGANGCMNGSVLVLVNRRRTAQYLAKYLSNCRALLLRNIRTTWVAGHGGRSADEGGFVCVMITRRFQVAW